MSDRNLTLNEEKAAILIDALPYMIDFSDKTMVISYTCSDILTVEQEQQMMLDLSILHSLGIHIVLVHDTRMGADKFRENKRLAKLLEFTGVKAIGVCGVDEQTLHMTIENRYIPVITPNDIDTEYLPLDPIDTAREIACILKAEKLIYVSRYDGVRDKNAQICPSVKVDELKEHIARHPMEARLKLMFENAVTALEAGVQRVHVINGRLEHTLLLELFSVEGIGTAIMANHSSLYHHEELYYQKKL